MKIPSRNCFMHPVRTLWVAVALVLGAGCSAAAAEPVAKLTASLVNTDSRLDNVKLSAADADWNWTFKSADGKDHSFTARQVVRYGAFVRAKGQHRVRTLSKSELVGHSIQIEPPKIELASDLLDLVELPIDSVAAIVFNMPTDDEASRALDERIAAAQGRSNDTLVLTNGDQIDGRLTRLARQKLTFSADENDVTVDQARIAAIIFGRRRASEPTEPGKLVTWIGLSDGSRLYARQLTIDGKRATIQLDAAVATSTNIDAVAALQPLGGDGVYLSDLDDAGYRHVAFLSLPWEYRRDQSVPGGPLLAGGRLYLKGLGMHSAARITYKLDGEFRKFQAELGIDDAAGGLSRTPSNGLPRAQPSGLPRAPSWGSVTCRVFTDDGSGKWELKYESPIIRGGHGVRPTPVDVEITGAKRISLLVDFADRGDEHDHINWLDARVIK